MVHFLSGDWRGFAPALTITFTAPSDDGGADITDYEYQLDTGTWTTASTTNSPVVITGLPSKKMREIIQRWLMDEE
jgi:hypothetical protein